METKLKKSLTAGQILSIKQKSITLGGEWGNCLGTIGRHGMVLVWGGSGSGKSSGVMMLARELCKFGRVLYVSMEEGFSLSFQQSLRRFGLEKAGPMFNAIEGCGFEDLTRRLFRRKSAEFVVIDSIQYIGLNYKKYCFLKAQFPNKLFILISHACGRQPDGRGAVSIMYDADVKIWVEGGKAFTRGRFFGPTGEAVIWPERAFEYYGNIDGIKED